MKQKDKKALEENSEAPLKKKKVNGRDKGHNFERQLVLIFKNLGFTNCQTSRYASRLLDDCKVDLANGPNLNIQAKSGYWQNRFKPEVIFKDMKTHIDSNFPPGTPLRDYPRVIFHKLDGQQDEHQMVIMLMKDWLDMYKELLELRKNQVK